MARGNRTENILAVCTFLSLIIAAVIGFNRGLSDILNIYCHHICPFGTVQECLAVFGKAKHLQSKQYVGFFKWLRRGIVWLAVLVALIFRNPGISFLILHRAVRSTWDYEGVTDSTIAPTAIKLLNHLVYCSTID